MIDLVVEVECEVMGAEHQGARAVYRNGRWSAMLFTTARTLEWQTAFACAVARYFPDEPINEALRLDWLAVKRRPVDMRERPTELIWCPRRPDFDNVLENILDALNTERIEHRPRLMADDGLVTVGTGLMCYGPRGAGSGVVFRLRSADAFDPMCVAEALDLVPSSVTQKRIPGAACSRSQRRGP